MTNTPNQKKYTTARTDETAIPQSLAAERSVLGGLMIKHEAWSEVAAILEETDFYAPAHRLIYQAMSQLVEHGEPFDVITVSEALKARRELSRAGGEVSLFELAAQTPSAANISAYARIVHEQAMLRQLLTLSQEMAAQARQTQGRTCREVLSDVEAKLFAIRGLDHSDAGPEEIQSILARTTERIDTLYDQGSEITGLSTGFEALDALTLGLQPESLFVLAARPGMGKSVMAMNIVQAALTSAQRPVLVMSLEMSSEHLVMRMISAMGRIDQTRLRSGRLVDSDWMRLSAAVGTLSTWPLYIDETPALTVSQLRSRVDRLVRDKGSLGLIVIDYLQLMTVSGKRETRAVEISEISRALKGLAKTFHVPVLALSQLNRSLEHRQDRRPVMSDLRASGGIEQDADVIAFIYRDEVYHPETQDKGLAELIITKQRHGATGKVYLQFEGQYACFKNTVPPSCHGMPTQCTP